MLNMLRRARVNTKLSSYAVLEGQFNFNKTPLAPVGTKALVFLDQKHQKNFQYTCSRRILCGPCYETLHKLSIFIPETGGYRSFSSALQNASDRTRIHNTISGTRFDRGT